MMAASGVSIAKPTVDDLLKWGADFGPQTSHGQWWRLFTSMFVHIGIVHITANMLAFAYVGPKVERMFGNVGFLLIYVVSGLGGSLLALGQNPLEVQAGASGAIFGVYGALFAVLLRTRDSIPQHVRANLRRFVSTFIAYNLIYSFSPGISLSAHLGGLITGFICGFAIAQPLEGADVVAGRPQRNAVVAGIGVLVLVIGIFAVSARYPALNRVDEIITHFAAVERQSRATFADARERLDGSQLSDEGFADIIEQKVLPDWRSTRDEMDQLARLPSSKIARLNEYSHMRQQQLEGLASALRKNNDEAVRSALEDGKVSSDRLSNWSAAK